MKNQQKLINIEKENVLKPSVWPTFVRNNQGIFLYIKSKIGLWSLFFHSKRTCCNESENFYDGKYENNRQTNRADYIGHAAVHPIQRILTSSMWTCH